MRKVWTESDLFSVPIPDKTDTYTPVSHSSIVSKVTDHLQGKGMVIRDKKYIVNNDGQQVIGTFTINTDRPSVANSKTAMDMMIAFRNSYDKSMSVGFAAGARVWICSNGMVSGDMRLIRKHTGNVDEVLNEKIEDSIGVLEQTYEGLVNDAQVMSNIDLMPTRHAELLGRLFIEDEIISSTQLNIIKREMKDSQHFAGSTMWDLYNNCTEAMKVSHASSYLPGLIALHDFFKDEMVSLYHQ